MKIPKKPRKPQKPERAIIPISCTLYPDEILLNSVTIDGKRSLVVTNDLIAFHDIPVTARDIRIVKEVDYYDDSYCSLVLHWEYPESDESYDKRVISYEKRLADYAKKLVVYEKWISDNQDVLDEKKKAAEAAEIKKLRTKLAEATRGVERLSTEIARKVKDMGEKE